MYSYLIKVLAGFTLLCLTAHSHQQLIRLPDNVLFQKNPEHRADILAKRKKKTG